VAPMPISKSKRKKKGSAKSAAGSFGAKPGIELLLGDAIAKELDTDAGIAELRAAGQGFRPEQLEEAQDLAFEAWESEDPERRVGLVATALKLCPWCGDAYGLLAMDAPPNSDIAIHLWRMAVAAAEFALKAELGQDVFDTHAGDFWGVLETRPYMRARAGLSHALWDFGERDAALAIDLEGLRLNPNDNQGARYIAACRLLALGRDRELKELFDAYPDEDSAFFAFTRAAWSFQREGDSENSRQLLAEAIDTNRHVPVYLLGRKRMPESLPGFYGEGDEDEAVHYSEMSIEAWRSVTGALTWLSKRARLPQPGKRWQR
jgi:tetratricopeptide (TPR) repeat protein